MEKAKISAMQFFVLILLFEMGSALLFGLGGAAKQDAWISILLGMGGGLVLFLIYYRLFLYYPNLQPTTYVQHIIGVYPGKVLAVLYILYFIYLSARVLRDFGELLTTTIYTNTPIFIINTLMIFVIIYAVHKGIEVIARVGELYFGLVYFLAISGAVLILVSGLIHIENLQPVLENGWKPIFRTVLTETITFPFGEMITFTMIFPLLNHSKKLLKVGLAAMILSGINITITSVINISALGVNLFERSPFPLLNTVGKIEIADFIERLDVLFMLYLVIGGFFKVTIFFYAAVAGAADLFKFENPGKVCAPIGLMILFASMVIAANYSEHIKEGLQIVPLYLHWPFQIIFPSLLLVIAYFRNRKKDTTSLKS